MFRKVFAIFAVVGLIVVPSVYAQPPQSIAKESRKLASDDEVTEVTVLLKRKGSSAPIYDRNRPYKSFFTSSDGCGYYGPRDHQSWDGEGPRPISDYEKAYYADFTGRDRLRDAPVTGAMQPDGEYDEPLSDCEMVRNRAARNDTKLKDAFALYEAKRYPEALSMFQRAYGKIGHEVAALMIGDMYLRGEGVTKDVRKAIVWYRKVAEKPIHGQEPFDPENPDIMSPRVEAAMILAQIYIVGADMPRDLKAGLRWLQKASDIGYVPATKLVGDFYYKGQGTPKNLKLALRNYQTAAEFGYAPAQYAWAQILEVGDASVAADPVKARDLYALAARRGHAGAQYQMAVLYETGEGVTANPKTALIYYKDAALGGDADAQNAIGTWFYQGDELLPKDGAVARQWFETAALSGHAEAAFNLAVMHVRGEGGQKDMIRAWLWFDIARRAGHADAAKALAEVDEQLTEAQKAEIARITAPKS